ncbi:MAG: hypothetical protein JXA99_15965 [Candidatus Lokiarchaeota archaeon]|nr:hypothetical protein [Candidatus Lokiarchaeota archaeon]
MDDETLSDISFFSFMVKKYWKIALLLVIGIVVAIIAAIFTLFYIFYHLDIGAYGTWSIGQFSVGDVILGFLWVILLELLIVGLPTLAYLGTIFGIWWYKLISPEDKEELKKREKQSNKKIKRYGGGAGAFGFFVFIFFLIILQIDGNIFTDFNTLPYVYWIETWLWAVLWTFVIIGVPCIILGLWYLKKKLYKL